MDKLIALIPILYKNKQYEPGEELPSDDAAYVQAWEEAGSAAWRGDDNGENDNKIKKPKAKPLTAPAGLEGIAAPATGAEPDLVGKVPSGKARGAVKQPKKRAPKSPA